MARSENTGSRKAERMSGHAMRSSRSGGTDTSQNHEIDDLNQQSLQAAQQGHSFDVGSAGGNSGSMGKSGMGSGGMGSGGMGSGGMTPGSRPGGASGSSSPSGSGSPAGSSHM
jgi:hypothetical protein